MIETANSTTTDFAGTLKLLGKNDGFLERQLESKHLHRPVLETT
jgi:hypothetical protein